MSMIFPRTPFVNVRTSELLAKAFWGLHAALREGRYREYWLMGGRGSAKSSFASLEILLGLIRDSDANAIVYRKVAATLRESVYEQVLWAAEMLGVGAFFRGKPASMEIEYLPTGQRILFRGGNDPGKSRSIKLSQGYFKYLWFEELSEFSGMEDIRSIKASVLRGGNEASTFYTFNPPRSTQSWVNLESIAPRKDRIVHKSVYTDLPKAWLGEDFLAEAQHLQHTNERAYRHMYLGEAIGTGGQVFDNLNLSPISQSTIDGIDRFVCGLDFGFASDPDAFVKAYVDARTGSLILLEEFYGVRTPIERLCAEVALRSKGSTVRCDSADPRMICALREHGIQAIGAKKGPGSVEHGIRWLQERTEIRIDPERCPNAAREFSRYEYLSDRNGNFLAEAPDKDNHLIDALRYAVEEISQRREAKTVRRDFLGI